MLRSDARQFAASWASGKVSPPKWIPQSCLFGSEPNRSGHCRSREPWCCEAQWVTDLPAGSGGVAGGPDGVGASDGCPPSQDAGVSAARASIRYFVCIYGYACIKERDYTRMWLRRCARRWCSPGRSMRPDGCSRARCTGCCGHGPGAPAYGWGGSRVGAENGIRAGHAACRYSCTVSPRRSCRRMSRRMIWAGVVIGSGVGRSGAACRRARWGRWGRWTL